MPPIEPSSGRNYAFPTRTDMFLVRRWWRRVTWIGTRALVRMRRCLERQSLVFVLLSGRALGAAPAVAPSPPTILLHYLPRVSLPSVRSRTSVAAQAPHADIFGPVALVPAPALRRALMLTLLRVLRVCRACGAGESRRPHSPASKRGLLAAYFSLRVPELIPFCIAPDYESGGPGVRISPGGRARFYPYSRRLP